MSNFYFPTSPENQEEGRIFVNLVDTLAYVYADKNDVDAEIFIRIFNSKGVRSRQIIISSLISL